MGVYLTGGYIYCKSVSIHFMHSFISQSSAAIRSQTSLFLPRLASYSQSASQDTKLFIERHSKRVRFSGNSRLSFLFVELDNARYYDPAIGGATTSS